ncbi:disulfide bond formation protein C [Comamonadaceae bacterium OS-1]|nr:disulfide bond formation protein C [Comamonadaceae bacterium OS-1]
MLSTAGSLFLSEVMDYAPCVLCWYQRIPMYALVVVLGVGLYEQDPGVVKYAKPLALIGVVLAAYHCLLYLGFIPKSIQPCGKGPSCGDVKLELWGFVTIPLMSLLAFLALCTGLYLSKKKRPK